MKLCYADMWECVRVDVDKVNVLVGMKVNN